MTVEAVHTVRHSPDEVFLFLADLRNHWRLEDRFLALEEVHEEGENGEARGGVVRVYGPLRTFRRARTQVLAAQPPAGVAPAKLAGIAHVGRRTVGRVAWELVPDGDGTRVRLAASVEHASLLDRLLLALGGRLWLASIFRNALRNLDRAIDEAATGSGS